MKTSFEKQMENTNILFLQLKACNDVPNISLPHSSQILELVALGKQQLHRKLLLLTLTVQEKDCLNFINAKKKGNIASPYSCSK